MADSASLVREGGPTGRIALITGGAGFIGSNLAQHLLRAGWSVTVLDNLSRAGVERNARWLQRAYGERVRLVQADVRDPQAVRRCLGLVAAEGALPRPSAVFHLAAQVAVTSSLADPLHDFSVNAGGTLTLLQALRECATPPPLLYTSTNKVYGCLEGLQTRRLATRYEPLDPRLAAHGIGEDQPLDFQSPYGCSKGVADQYVLEYARSFGLRAVVFRMSCIYGPRQFGTEDQGWIAHFLISAMQGKPITLYGDGCQVRDALYIDDLVAAMHLVLDALLAYPTSTLIPSGVSDAADSAGVRPGRAYNIGGGPAHATSLLEVIETLSAICGTRPDLRYDTWRPGDQRYYVSNTDRFAAATGWRPRVSLHEGLERLHTWLLSERIVSDRARMRMPTQRVGQDGAAHAASSLQALQASAPLDTAKAPACDPRATVDASLVGAGEREGDSL